MPKWSDLTVEDRLDELQEELNRLRLFVPAHGASHRFGGEDTTARLPAFIRVRKAADQTIATSSGTKVLLDTLDWGPRGPQLLWDSANNQIDVLETGIYLVAAGIRWATNSTGVRTARIYVNGSQVALASSTPSSAGQCIVTLTIPIRAVAGDYIELYGWQDSGGDLVCVAIGETPWFSVAYMSPTT